MLFTPDTPVSDFSCASRKARKVAMPKPVVAGCTMAFTLDA